MKNDKDRSDLKDAIARIMLKKTTDLTKRYYSISEVVEMFPELSASRIRFWEGQFNTINPQKDSAGNRRFTKKDIDDLRLVYHLVQEKGFTLEGAKREIEDNAQRHIQKMELIDTLSDIKKMLLHLKEQIA